jgi:hypothetical protein
MKIELEAIGHALKDKLLEVPVYQRSYAWEEAHVTDLLMDLSTAVAEDDAEYFLGSIVTTFNEANRYEIADGQQRLATAAILVAAIRDYFFEKGDTEGAESLERDYLVVRHFRTRDSEPRLRLNASDHDFFVKRILSRPDSSDREVEPQRGSHHRIARAAELARVHVERIASSTSKPGDRLADLVEFLDSRARVIWVRAPDSANAFVIFETLNDRGLQLAISDLLKNYLLLTAGNRQNEVLQEWVSMTATLETVEDATIVVDFIRHLWSSHNGATREHKLYAAMKGGVTTKQAAVNFAKELASGAKMYVALLNPTNEIWNQYGTTAKGHVATINMLGMVQIRPLMLAVLSKFSVPEVRKALRLMVAWGVRFLISGGLGGGTLERHYAERAKEVRANKLKTTADLADAMTGVVPNDKKFQAEFESANVSKAALARYYLHVLERQRRNDKHPEFIPNPNEEEVNLEHVLPQTPSNAWSHVTKDAPKAYYRRIGNLALMNVPSNSKAGNDSFAAKKKLYATSDFELTKELAELPRWDVETIEARQGVLAKLAIKAWSIKP